MTFGSLFSGFGGMDKGFEDAGFKCEWQVEINEYARRVLAKHWPSVRRWEDARTFPPVGDWRVDCIIGGDPCQENSNARQTKHTTSPSLGSDFIRIVEQLRPRIVVRENPTVVKADSPWPWQRFRSELRRIGYSVLPFRLRACCFGADHRRDRLFLLAELNDALCERLEGARTPREYPVSTSRPIRRERLSESDVVRKRNGIPNYVERIRGCGNAVVPHVAQWIAKRIIECTN